MFAHMPVIVVGADTKAGEKIVDSLAAPQREVRVFVSDPDTVEGFRSRGIKVALGDVSDDSHVAGASLNCFSAVLVTEAAGDDRERSFAASPEEVLQGWADAVSEAKVRRVIWVVDGEPPETKTQETARVSSDHPDLGQAVARLDEAQSIG